jgi:hypothetical protein
MPAPCPYCATPNPEATQHCQGCGAVLSRSLPAGTILAGRYTLHTVLGNEDNTAAIWSAGWPGRSRHHLGHALDLTTTPASGTRRSPS